MTVLPIRILLAAGLAVAPALPALSGDPADTGAAFRGSPGVDGGACCRTLGEVRTNIDRIDRALVRLMAEREKYVREAARFKKDAAQVEVPARAAAVVARARRLAGEYGLSPDVAAATFRAMVAAFTEEERGVFPAAKP